MREVLALVELFVELGMRVARRAKPDCRDRLILKDDSVSVAHCQRLVRLQFRTESLVD